MNRILIMDDDRSIQLLYEDELTEAGYEVITSGDGSRLLELIERKRPDLIVLDIRLGEYNGLDLLQYIRNRYINLPVILCTAYPAFKHDLKSVAADYYLVKSSDLSELKLKVEMAMNGRTQVLESSMPEGVIRSKFFTVDVMGSNITHKIAQTSEVENMSKTEDREEISRMYPKSLPHTEQAIFETKECNRTPLTRNLTAESSKRILIVDDEKYIRDILSEILSTMGFEVVVASNGSEGLELFHRDCFDLVLTDLQMPGMDGWTLALRIKDESSNTPVVLITGFDREGIMEKLKGSCVDCAVFKPFRLEDIQRTVQKILAKPPSMISACTSTTNASLISSRAVQNPGPFP